MTMTGKHVRAPISSLRRNSIRDGLEPEDVLTSLARSWLSRPIHPIIWRSDFTVVDGHRRLDGLLLLGETEVDGFQTDADLSDAELLEAGWATAYHRKGLSGAEQWRTLENIVAAYPSLKQRDIAEKLHVNEGTVSRGLSPSKCVLAVQEALKAGKIGLADCADLARLSQEDQLVGLTKRLAGGKVPKPPRDPGETPPDKVARLPIRLAVEEGDISVHGTVTLASMPGEEMDLDSAEGLLVQALRALRDAKKRGISPRTFAKAMKDMAEAS
ncbi:hypothetical protein ACYOEI_06815 [Singulisphaera rosea]